MRPQVPQQAAELVGIGRLRQQQVNIGRCPQLVGAGSGEHDDRRVLFEALRAQCARDVEAITVGQSKIEQDRLGRLLHRNPDRLGAGLGMRDIAAIIVQSIDQASGEIAVVLDDKNSQRPFFRKSKLHD
jgi:hypothetical protein